MGFSCHIVPSDEDVIAYNQDFQCPSVQPEVPTSCLAEQLQPSTMNSVRSPPVVSCSIPWSLACGVPRGLVLFPMLFGIYMKLLREVVQNFGF